MRSFYDLAAPASLLLCLMSAACSGGNPDRTPTATFDCGAADVDVLCLQSCNLGCSETGCGRTDIAQNEVIVLIFSEDVDPLTVTPGSIVLRTATGVEAQGEYLVVGNRVEFVPTLAISGGQTFYGFTSGETYYLTIIGGGDEASVVRGTSGRPFGQTVACVLESRRGIIDHDGEPPSAELVSPAMLSEVSRDTEILVEFSELVDPTPFLNGVQSPVRFYARNTFVENGGLVCNTSFERVPLSGSAFPNYDIGRGITVLSFTPAERLPGNACIEIDISSEVVDMSGRPATPTTFRFLTEQTQVEEDSIEESFDDADFLDENLSAATWDGGFATFAKIGGDGRHGVFDLSMAEGPFPENGQSYYLIDCDNTEIGAEHTTIGSPMVVTNGRFYFSEFVLPQSTWLRFVGSSPPVITVSGRIEIRGHLDVSGRSLSELPDPTFTTPLASGQPGADGGPLGGRGGAGGDQCDGLGSGNLDDYQGRDGETVGLVAGHAYAGSRIGTGGIGSTLYPESGLTSARLFNTNAPGFKICLNMSAGGGGGSSVNPGTPGEPVSTNVPDPVTGIVPWAQAFGESAGPSTTATVFPFLGGSTASHFLVGGAGGGGAASNTMMTVSTLVLPRWAPGGGGAGGGGAVALRTGSSLRLAMSGRINARGGSTPDLTTLNTNQPHAIPGGAGAGGSVVLQSDRALDLFGPVDVRGGAGGVCDRTYLQPPGGGQLVTKGGDGGAGLARFELPDAVAATLIGSVQPAAATVSVADLEERDALVMCQSKFYETGLTLTPQWLRYEIEATVDGQPTTFSDDPAVSTLPATAGTALRALFQAVTLDLSTGVVLSSGPWRTSVRSSATQTGIASDEGNAVRFRLVVDRAFAQQVRVDRVAMKFLK